LAAGDATGSSGGIREDGMIEHIEELNASLDLVPLSELEHFGHRQVPIPEARVPEQILGRCAVRAVGRRDQD